MRTWARSCGKWPLGSLVTSRTRSSESFVYVVIPCGVLPGRRAEGVGVLRALPVQVAVEVEEDGVGVEGGAVMEFHALAEGEGPGPVVVGDLPGGGQRCGDGGGPVGPGQVVAGEALVQLEAHEPLALESGAADDGVGVGEFAGRSDDEGAAGLRAAGVVGRGAGATAAWWRRAAAVRRRGRARAGCAPSAAGPGVGWWMLVVRHGFLVVTQGADGSPTGAGRSVRAGAGGSGLSPSAASRARV